MGDEDEGEAPYVGLYCKCGLRAPDPPLFSCPDCMRPWPEILQVRYFYDGGPEIYSTPKKDTPYPKSPGDHTLWGFAFRRGQEFAERERLRARRKRRKTGKDAATYTNLINVMQHLIEWGCETPLHKVHWDGNTLMLWQNADQFSPEQLEDLAYQQCTPGCADAPGDHLVMRFNEEED